MTTAIFVGPTLRQQDISAIGAFELHPPAGQGDIYRVAMRSPNAIGLIDGYFSGAPSVWHKEILWALSQGIAVFGSASMGALRAAELCDFGMRGVGRIFEAFRNASLEDDDEVAVTHGPAELGFIPTSEAMVNIRATLAIAEANGIIAHTSRATLEILAKAQYFADRSWGSLLQAACSSGLAEAELTRLADWLTEGAIDQKRIDALEMLSVMKSALPSSLAPRPTFQFEWTYLWDEFVRRESLNTSSTTTPFRPVLDELRLEGSEAYERIERSALLRLVAGSHLPALAAEGRVDLRTTLAKTRETLRLFSHTAFKSWIAENELDETSLQRIVGHEGRIMALRQHIGRSLEPLLIDAMRLSGDYARLRERARRKSAMLAAADRPGASGAGATLRKAGDRLWYFEERLGVPVPDDLDGYRERLGFPDMAAFDTAIAGERLFLSAEPAQNRA